jgi:catechol 2,3-dioxygenase-like lactoylglutathione lyase family enzyme
VNAPGRVNRLNQHRKWRLRAMPKVIAHVVFAVPGYDAAAAFMIERLGFRLSDNQRGFGQYLRAPGANNHHNLLLLNANAPFPGMDGMLRFHHANFGVEDIDEIMVGANHMVRQGWEPSHLGLGRHRIDSALFYYLPCPAGGEAEYGADADYVDDSWVPRDWAEPLFAYSHFVHNLPPFLMKPPAWDVRHITGIEPASGEHH